MNAGLLILRIASERRDAQNERDGAGLRSSVAARSSDSVAAPSQQHYKKLSTFWGLKRAMLGISDPQNNPFTNEWTAKLLMCHASREARLAKKSFLFGHLFSI